MSNDETIKVEDMPPLEVIGEGEDSDQRTLLKLWKEILQHVEPSSEEKVSMAAASKIVSSWPKISYQETPLYWQMYHALLLEMRDILSAVVKDNPEAVDIPSDQDIEENRALYKRLIVEWNVALDDHEREWDPADEDSHIRFAAIIDVRGFLFARTGFSGHLEARGFDMDPDEVAEAIREARGEQ